MARSIICGGGRRVNMKIKKAIKLYKLHERHWIAMWKKRHMCQIYFDNASNKYDNIYDELLKKENKLKNGKSVKFLPNKCGIPIWE